MNYQPEKFKYPKKTMNKFSYLELIFRTLEEDATEAEQKTVQQWLNESEENQKFFNDTKKIHNAARSQRPRNTLNVETAWQNVSRKIETAETPRLKKYPRQQTLSLASFFPTLWRYVGVAAVIFIMAFYGGYRLSLPEYIGLAELNQWQQKNLRHETRGEPAATKGEFARGTEALLSARQTKWGIFPYFEPQQVEQAITHLHNAFVKTEDPVNRNKIAFFLAKAFLMQEDVSAARQWLNKALASEAVAYREEATKLLEQLPSTYQLK